MKTLLCLLLLASSSVTLASPANGYFGGLDSSLPTHSPAGRLQAERYLMLTARLSVFAMYCDLHNSRGLNSKAAEFRHRSQSLQSQAESVLGGTKSAYNHFENNRNNESLRLVKLGQAQVCSQGLSTFRSFVGMSSSSLEKLLKDRAFGQL